MPGPPPNKWRLAFSACRDYVKSLGGLSSKPMRRRTIWSLRVVLFLIASMSTGVPSLSVAGPPGRFSTAARSALVGDFWGIIVVSLSWFLLVRQSKCVADAGSSKQNWRRWMLRRLAVSNAGTFACAGED